MLILVLLFLGLQIIEVLIRVLELCDAENEGSFAGCKAELPGAYLLLVLKMSLLYGTIPVTLNAIL